MQTIPNENIKSEPRFETPTTTMETFKQKKYLNQKHFICVSKDDKNGKSPTSNRNQQLSFWQECFLVEKSIFKTWQGFDQNIAQN